MVNLMKLIGSELLHKLNYQVFSEDLDGRILKNIQKQGYHVIPGFLSEDVCLSLVEKVDRFINENPDKIVIESNGYDKRVYKIDDYTNDFNDESLDELSERLFKKFSFIQESSHFVLMNRITGGADNLGSGSGWHRDSPFSHQFKTILYLNDVEENGPFQFIEGSHRFGSLRKVSKFLGKKLNLSRFTADEVDKLIEASVIPSPIRFSAPAGSLIIADTRGLHRGSPLQEGVRYALTHYHFSRESQRFEF